MRAASHSACGANGYNPHGNSRESQQDQRFMTITLQRHACYSSVITLIALLSRLLLFSRIRVLRALVATASCIFPVINRERAIAAATQSLCGLH